MIMEPVILHRGIAIITSLYIGIMDKSLPVGKKMCCDTIPYTMFYLLPIATAPSISVGYVQH